MSLVYPVPDVSIVNSEPGRSLGAGGGGAGGGSPLHWPAGRIHNTQSVCFQAEINSINKVVRKLRLYLSYVFMYSSWSHRGFDPFLFLFFFFLPHQVKLMFVGIENV